MITVGRRSTADRPPANVSHRLAVPWPPRRSPGARRPLGERALPQPRSPAVLVRGLAVSPSARETAVPGRSCWRASIPVWPRPPLESLRRLRLLRRPRLLIRRPQIDRRAWSRKRVTSSRSVTAGADGAREMEERHLLVEHKCDRRDPPIVRDPPSGLTTAAALQRESQSSAGVLFSRT